MLSHPEIKEQEDTFVSDGYVCYLDVVDGFPEVCHNLSSSIPYVRAV